MKRTGIAVLGLLMIVTFSAAQLWASSAGPGMSPDDALNLLKEGNGRYVSGAVKHPNQEQARRSETAAGGQHPYATVLGCSDSRVPVEILFDSGVGDIFVIRVAGNIADKDETGTIEYGVDHLGTPLVVVLGHSKCGAVTATVQGAAVHGNIEHLVQHIKPAVAKAKAGSPGASGDALVNEAIKANVWQVIEDLFKTSPVLREKAQASQVKVVGAIYNIETAKIDWLGPHPKQAGFLGKASPAEAAKPAAAGKGKKQ